MTISTDDDNDIEMAMAVRRAYLPGITSESLRRVVEANPDHFYVAARKSVFATEEILALLRSDAAVTAPPPAEGKMPTT